MAGARHRLRRVARKARRRVRRLVSRALRRDGRLRSGPRNIRAGVTTSVRIARKHRQLCLVYRTREGYWVHRYRDGATVSATPQVGPTIRRLKARARDYFLQEYEPQPGDVVVDVGAGVGAETFLFSELVGPQGRVYAIEAHPETYTWLERTCRVNRMRNVVPVFLAITDTAGEIAITDRQKHIANRLVADGEGLRVPATTFDAFVASHGIDRVDFLKMNIEGAERLAIRGMDDSVDLITNVCISCHDFIAEKRRRRQEMRTKSEVRQFLVDTGFHVVERRPGDTRPWARDYLYGRRSPAGAGAVDSASRGTRSTG